LKKPSNSAILTDTVYSFARFVKMIWSGLLVFYDYVTV